MYPMYLLSASCLELDFSQSWSIAILFADLLRFAAYLLAQLRNCGSFKPIRVSLALGYALLFLLLAGLNAG